LIEVYLKNDGRLLGGYNLHDLVYYNLLIKSNNGDGVHQNRIMLMTPTGNNNPIPVGVF